MKKFCCIALACSAVLLSQGACSETPREEAASVGEFAPLSDFYDNVWVRGSNAESTTLDQVAKDLSEYDVVFFGEYHGHSGRSEEHTSELQSRGHRVCRHMLE